MFGKLNFQLRKELSFIKLPEVCLANKQFAQLRMGFTEVFIKYGVNFNSALAHLGTQLCIWNNRSENATVKVWFGFPSKK